ncbi:unnamed protein product [Scytosiphon promiscuus]
MTGGCHQYYRTFSCRSFWWCCWRIPDRRRGFFPVPFLTCIPAYLRLTPPVQPANPPNPNFLDYIISHSNTCHRPILPTRVAGPTEAPRSALVRYDICTC